MPVTQQIPGDACDAELLGGRTQNLFEQIVRSKRSGRAIRCVSRGTRSALRIFLDCKIAEVMDAARLLVNSDVYLFNVCSGKCMARK
jgi:hypothetical protein